MDKLNKCPFCGGSAGITGRKKIKIVCKKCGATSPTFDFKSDAVEYWNNRAAGCCSEQKISQGD